MQVCGIQQVGIGIPDVHEAWAWYRKAFGMRIPVFEEAATADLMLPYTGGQPQKRHAILALNLQGGGGFEIWQYTGRMPQAANFDIHLGDYGIFAARIKTREADIAKKHLEKLGAWTSEIFDNDGLPPHFYTKDPFGNYFEVSEYDSWFSINSCKTGGPFGVILGVKSIEDSLKLYRDVLGYDEITHQFEGISIDLSCLPGGSREIHRVRLSHSGERKGAFSALFGKTELELVELKDRSGKSIYQDRYWGDLGFIHLCFDIRGMKELEQKCLDAGFPFTVDSSKAHEQGFDMGEAAGHFSYIEDPSGTLIEFVETHKVPIMKKWNWYLDLTKRPEEKRLPKWMIKSMGMNKKSD